MVEINKKVVKNSVQVILYLDTVLLGLIYSIFIYSVIMCEIEVISVLWHLLFKH